MGPGPPRSRPVAEGRPDAEVLAGATADFALGQSESSPGVPAQGGIKARGKFVAGSGQRERGGFPKRRRTNICLDVAHHLVGASSLLVPLGCSPRGAPPPSLPPPSLMLPPPPCLSLQVRIRLGSLHRLGGRQPHRAGGVPPVLLLPPQGAARTAVLPAVAAFHGSGVRLTLIPALPPPSAAPPPPKNRARPRCSHPAWSLDAP